MAMDEETKSALAAITSRLDALTPAQEEAAEEQLEEVKEEAAEAAEAGEEFDAKSAVEAIGKKVDDWIAANPPRRTVQTRKPAPKAPVPKAPATAPAGGAPASTPKRRKGWFSE